MRLTRKNLRKLILREFKLTGQAFDDLIGNTGSGEPPPTKPPKRGGGSGEGWPTSVVERLINAEYGSLSKWTQDPRNSRAAVYDNSQIKLYAKAVDSQNSLVCTLVRGNKVLDRYVFIRKSGGASGMLPRMMEITNNICDMTGSEAERKASEYKEYNKSLIDFMTRSGPPYKGDDCAPPEDDGTGWIRRY
tara:strand:- start:1347 stop:1916 length:570 start_codon:yes stop_codon:yes gene_type:complete